VNNRRGGTIVLARELALYQTIGYNPAPFKAVTGDLGARRLSSARRKVRAARPRNHRRIRPAARCARQCGKKSVRAGSRAMDRPALQGGVGAANARLRDYRYWYEEALRRHEGKPRRLEAGRRRLAHQPCLAVTNRGVTAPFGWGRPQYRAHASALRPVADASGTDRHTGRRPRPCRRPHVPAPSRHLRTGSRCNPKPNRGSLTENRGPSGHCLTCGATRPTSPYC